LRSEWRATGAQLSVCVCVRVLTAGDCTVVVTKATQHAALEAVAKVAVAPEEGGVRRGVDETQRGFLKQWR
jgi:hypothetical protein